MTKKVVNVALLGTGTVGTGVIEVLKNNSSDITQKVGLEIKLKSILVRNPDKAAELKDDYNVTNDFNTILADDEIDVVIELIGREHPAKEYIAEALNHKKSVVTANKDVIAKYGHELLELADLNGVDLLFEASVGGGIPIIRPLKASLAANKISSIMGIVNGTTNFMLTKMTNDNLDFDTVLKEAQEMGYAESDPTADIGGLDAARKLAILASIAFNARTSLEDINVEGIEKLQLRDVQYAKELGYIIKLLAIGKFDEKIGANLSVRPTMLPKEHPLANVNDVFNAIFVTGDAVGETMFLGRGAGGLPTASAICADLIDIARNIRFNSKGRISCTCFKEKKIASEKDIMAPCYIRLLVEDKTGVLGGIATAFGAHNVSLKNVVQKVTSGEFSELVLITYAVSDYNLKLAINTLNSLPIVHEVCSIIRVEDNNL
jgi:homoserine dehydrogenase